MVEYQSQSQFQSQPLSRSLSRSSRSRHSSSAHAPSPHATSPHATSPAGLIAVRSIVSALVAVALSGLWSSGAVARFDPARVALEPDAVAARFTDPPSGPGTDLDTPGFAPGREDFTSHAEVFAFVEALAAKSARVAVEPIGYSRDGLAMVMLVLTGERGFDPALPTVLLLGQQHGNEPAGGEAALAIARLLAGERQALLDRVNVLIVPRSNPDGAARFERATTGGLDVNRDHLLLRTPEARALNAAVLRYQPQVVLDLHEFTVGGRWVTNYGAMMAYDALLQAAGTANLHPRVEAAQQRYLDAIWSRIVAGGGRVGVYFTTSPDPANRVVAMGGVNVDTGRNVAGLRQAVSVLIETRGVGIGRAHFARRVQTHVTAAFAVIETASADGRALGDELRSAAAEVAGTACQGPMQVAVGQTPGRQALDFLDAKSGEPKQIEVDWRASSPLVTLRSRTRPCGYLVAASQGGAVSRLRALGVRVQAIDSASSAAHWGLERYRVEDQAEGQRQDGRGAISDGQSIRVLKVSTEAFEGSPQPGDVYVPMDQPLAGLISAALEPDSQNSFAANRLLEIDAGQVRRVVRLPQPPTPSVRPAPLPGS